MEISRLIPAFLQGLGVVALVSISYDVLLHGHMTDRFRSVLVTALFALAVVAAMALPIDLGGGIYFDLRHVLLVLAAPYGGLFAAILTAAIASIYRLSLGGTGLTAGLAGIGISAAAGILYLMFLRLPRRSLKRLLVIGFLPSASLLSLGLLPSGRVWEVFHMMAFPLIGGNFIATIVVIALLDRKENQIEREAKLEEFAHTDPLTGIANRVKLEAVAPTMIDEALLRQKKTAVLIMDIDHFKQVNDTFGHAAGDHILAGVARLLKREMRDGDLVARYGGEEFVALLAVESECEAHAAAQRICRSVARSQHEVRGLRLSVTISIGVHLISCADGTFHDIMVLADDALYRAKAKGRNRVELAAAA
jgi:diguanylate cyclase